MFEWLSDMHAAALDLWFTDPTDLADPGVAESCAALLSGEERARAERYRFERNRHEYIATHTLTRLALSHAHPIPPQDWTYSFNVYRKPSPIPACGLSFNQSNTVGLAASLVARVMPSLGESGLAAPGAIEVGLDVEAFASAERVMSVVSDVFSPAERAQLDALPAADRPARALSLWTLKEAYIKARGMGLHLPLLKISFLFGGEEGIRLEVDPAVDDNPSRWRFCQLDFKGHRVSMVIEDNAIKADLWEFQPLLTPPVRLPDGKAPWFPASAGDSAR